MASKFTVCPDSWPELRFIYLRVSDWLPFPLAHTYAFISSCRGKMKDDEAFTRSGVFFLFGYIFTSFQAKRMRARHVILSFSDSENTIGAQISYDKVTRCTTTSTTYT